MNLEDMKRVEVEQGEGPVEGYWQRLEVLQRVRANFMEKFPESSPGIFDAAIKWHEDAIIKTNGGEV